MSALPPKADIDEAHWDVRLVAISGLLQRSKHRLSELPDNGFHRAPAK